MSMSELPEWLQDMVIEARNWYKWPVSRSIHIANIAEWGAFLNDVSNSQRNKTRLLQLLIDEVERLKEKIDDN